MPPRLVRSRLGPLALTVLLGALAGGALLSYRARLPEATAATARAMLVDAVGARRLTLPRLTGGFQYAPWGSDGGIPAGRQVALAARKIRHVDGPEADSVRGALHLVTANQTRVAVPVDAQISPGGMVMRSASAAEAAPASKRSLDAAVEAFREAVEGAPEDGAPRADLGAALLVRGETLGDPLDLIDALEVLGQAVALDPGSEEALFNYALALGSLFLGSQEREAWEGYLAVDNTSDWAIEARERLEVLDDLERSPEEWLAIRDTLRDAAAQVDTATLAELVAAHPQLARELGERELLPAWGEAVVAGSLDDAAQTLAAALALGEALASFNGDQLLFEAAQVATPGGESLARGYAAFGAAQPYLEQRDQAGALPLLTEARKALTDVATPLARWIAYDLALCAYWANDHDGATIGLSALTSTPDAGRYLSLQSKALRLHALIQRTWLHLGAAQDSSERALAAAEASHEIEPIASMRTSLAIVLDRLGESGAAWENRVSALRMRNEIHQPDRAYLLFAGPADRLVETGRAHAALPFLIEAVRAAEHADDPALLADAYRKLAGLLQAAGDRAGAVQALHRSSLQLPRIADLEVRAFLEVENLRYEGDLLVSIDPGAALSALDRAVERIDEIAYNEVRPSILLARSRAKRMQGRRDDAAMDLEAALAEVEEARILVPDSRQRISFFDQAQAVFEESILLALEQGKHREAFELADRARGRELLDGLRDRGIARLSSHAAGASAPGVVVERLSAVLSPEVALVQFGLYGDRAVAWAVSHESFCQVDLPASPSALRDRVKRLHEAADIDATEALDIILGDLYTVLIAPVLHCLRGYERLIVIPHQDLFLVPFPALREPKTGRRLMARSSVVVAPSAGFVVAAAGRSPPQNRDGRRSALVLGDPAFNPVLRPGLERLGAAAREAQAVHRRHGGRSRLLVGEEATRERFLALAPGFDIIHVAAHGEVDPDDPLNSRLVLAGNDSLGAVDVLGLDLSAVQLVVLSACDAGGGSLSLSEGALSLARAFLAAGARAVIAAVLVVEDERTAAAMDRLHGFVDAGHDPTDALRRIATERGNVSEDDYWLPLVYFGSVPYPP